MGTVHSQVTIRAGTPDDAPACGRICYEAFATLAEHHRFPPDFPSAGIATDLLAGVLSHPQFYAVVAEMDGEIVGSNFLDERSVIAGVGPITVDPEMQNRGVGRTLMEAVMERAAERRFPGVRLLQTAYHNRSLALYATLGFEVRALMASMNGDPIRREVPGYTVRSATERDLEACSRVCHLVHGHDRTGELLDAVQQGSAMVVEHDGRITGYCSALAFFGHAVGESDDDLKAVIGAGRQIAGPGILVPATNSDFLQWCLGQGLRIVEPFTLMTVGLYNEPAGAYMPSVLY
jgi:predicted N-acetyltransferase YhbS